MSCAGVRFNLQPFVPDSTTTRLRFMNECISKTSGLLLPAPLLHSPSLTSQLTGAAHSKLVHTLIVGPGSGLPVAHACTLYPPLNIVALLAFLMFLFMCSAGGHHG
jgi:hypothetical protein